MDPLIIGDGNIGDKSRQLYANRELLVELGLSVPGFVSLSTDVVDSYLDLNRKAGEPGMDRTLPPEMRDALEAVLDMFSSQPIAVRSDAFGEALGHGVYKTAFVRPKMKSLRKGLAEVIASYFTDEAFEFRREAGIGHGFGIQFMPLIGQQWRCQDGLLAHAPVFSGIGYTSRLPEDGYIRFNIGLSGAVDSRDAFKVTQRDIIRSIDLERIRQAAKGIPEWADYLGLCHQVEGLAWVYDRDIRKGKMASQSLDSRIWGRVRHMDLRPFMSSLDSLERVRKKPYYIEWALTADDEGYDPRFSILQISPIDNRPGIQMETAAQELSGECIIGNHSGSVDALVYCASHADIPLLRKLNSELGRYLLLYSNSLTSKGYDGRSKLRYQDCSGARGFIEIQDGNYAGEPEDHLLNRIDMTGRFFGVCQQKDLDRIFESHVAEGSYKVNASRQIGRFQVIKL